MASPILNTVTTLRIQLFEQPDRGVTSQEERGQIAIPVDMLTLMEWEVVGSLGNPHPKYAELLALVAHQKLRPARLVTREIALEDVNDTLQRMTR